MKQLLFLFTVLMFGLANQCTSDDNQRQQDTSCIVIDDLDTAVCQPAITFDAIITDDLDTAVFSLQSTMYMIGPSGKLVSAQVEIDTPATQVTYEGCQATSLTLPDMTSVSIGESGHYFPVRFAVGADTFTLLLQKSQIINAYNQVK